MYFPQFYEYVSLYKFDTKLLYGEILDEIQTESDWPYSNSSFSLKVNEKDLGKLHRVDSQMQSTQVYMIVTISKEKLQSQMCAYSLRSTGTIVHIELYSAIV